MITHRVCPRCGKHFATGYDALIDKPLPRYMICLKSSEIDNHKFDICFNCYSEIFAQLSNNKGDD